MSKFHLNLELVEVPVPNSAYPKNISHRSALPYGLRHTKNKSSCSAWNTNENSVKNPSKAKVKGNSHKISVMECRKEGGGHKRTKTEDLRTYRVEDFEEGHLASQAKSKKIKLNNRIESCASIKTVQIGTKNRESNVPTQSTRNLLNNRSAQKDKGQEPFFHQHRNHQIREREFQELHQANLMLENSIDTCELTDSNINIFVQLMNSRQGLKQNQANNGQQPIAEKLLTEYQIYTKNLFQMFQNSLVAQKKRQTTRQKQEKKMVKKYMELQERNVELMRTINSLIKEGVEIKRHF